MAKKSDENAERKNYDYMGSFIEGFARACKDGKWLHVKKDGAPLYEARYEEVDDFSEGFAAVKKEGLWTHIKSDGSLAHGQWFQWAFNFKIWSGLEGEGLLALVREQPINNARLKTETYRIRPNGTRFDPKAPKAQ